MADAASARGRAAPAGRTGITARRRLFLLAFRAKVMLFYPLLLAWMAVLQWLALELSFDGSTY